jgi:hypothetical protein
VNLEGCCATMVMALQKYLAPNASELHAQAESRSSDHTVRALTAPLIILAPMRSYSTLVASMLGQHPEMYSLLETHLFLFDTMRRWWATFGGTVLSHGLLRAIAELVMGHQNEATIALARLWILQRLNWSTAEVFHLLAKQVAPAVLIDKSPLVVNQSVHLERALREFPNAKFLHLTRHPLGYGRSYLRFFADLQVPVMADPQMVWHRQHSTILRFLETVSSKKQLRVKGEALLADPDQHLTRIAHWIGVRTDPVAIAKMKHPEKSPFARVGPRNAAGGGGDPSFFRDPKLHLHRSGGKSPTLNGSVPWRRDGVGFTAQVRELAHHFGYR